MAGVTANTDLQQLIETLGDLPSSPAIVSAVIGMATDLDTDLSDLGRVLSADEGLTAKVLRLSNSSFYGRSKQIGTVEDAIRTLGYYTLRSLVVASSSHALFKQKDLTRFLPVLWDHSLATAVAARHLGRMLRHPSTEEAFIAGLLHDVGKLVLTQKTPRAFIRVQTSITKNGQWCHFEKEEFGFTHVDVGVAMLEQWNLPTEIVEAIALHHTTPEASPERAVTLAQIVWLANHIANNIAGPLPSEETPDWPHMFKQANIIWDDENIETFLPSFREQLTQERWLFADPE